MKQMICTTAVALIVGSFVHAQAPPPPGRQGEPSPAPVAVPGAARPADPFPNPIPAADGVIRVNVVEFASIPDVEGVPARMMNLVTEPGTRRMFVNDMRGQLYRISEDGRTVTKYLDINLYLPVQSMGQERGFQNFALHPQFNQQGARGYGKFYTYTDTTNMMPMADFKPASGGMDTHHSVLLEWTARTSGAAIYDGGAPRELMRWLHPFQNHNGGMLAFNPIAAPDAPDFGLLYMGVADGGSGGDPLNMAQNLGLGFGKIFRIDPLGNNSRNKKYGIPASNPFINTPGALPEIWAYGVRNPQRFAWDARNGNMFVSDIGQNIVEEVSIATAGANLGWNVWEGSYMYVSRQGVGLENPRRDPNITYPVVEFGQIDPLLQTQSAAGALVVYRDNKVPQLAGTLIFADMPSGEVFYISADSLPNGGQDAIRRVLFNSGGQAKTLLDLIKARNVGQSKAPATRADLRISLGPDNQIFLLNKGDGTIRLIAP